MARSSIRFPLPVSSAGMPVIQTPIDKGNNKGAIAFPFRPGESGVRMSYKVPIPAIRRN